MEKIQPSRQQIIEDVRLWSKNYLEVSNVYLGGVPACPFAKKAWHDDKVWIAVKTKHSTYKKELNDCLKNLDFSKKDILIFCALDKYPLLLVLLLEKPEIAVLLL